MKNKYLILLSFHLIILLSYNTLSFSQSFNWAKKAGGNSEDFGYGISTDANGNAYVTGQFSGTATFGTIQLVSYGEGDIFVAKYDANGNYIWAKKAGGNSGDIGIDISTDANGNSYVTGHLVEPQHSELFS